MIAFFFFWWEAATDDLSIRKGSPDGKKNVKLAMLLV